MCITAVMNEETGTWIQNANPKPIKYNTTQQNNSNSSIVLPLFVQEVQSLRQIEAHFRQDKRHNSFRFQGIFNFSFSWRERFTLRSHHAELHTIVTEWITAI